ncbi:O-antigen ligase family protein [Thalassoroseus pseudoceratinae]|uniref:O-antigen ligase family protein n=1 Tax=Thalassoroseus pseudoceratinae TaxID=2713176 RepID=UPI001422F04F|nr:O-antigen ligase family protein [Thalassoroseus pseudoceratinae]
MIGILVTYSLTLFGTLAGLVVPFYGLLAYVALAILKPEALWAWSVPASNYSRLVALSMLLGWALRGCGDWRLGKAKGITLALVGFWFSSIFGAATSEVPEAGWYFASQIGKIVAPFIVGITTVRTTKQVRILAWVILICQGYIAMQMNLYYFGGYNKLKEEGFGGLDNNGYAISLNAAIGLAFFLGLYEEKLWKKGIAFFFWLMMVNAVLFSYSRGGMLALCITGGIAFLLIPKRSTHYLMLGLAIALGVRLAGEEVTERFMTIFADAKERDRSAESRLELWGACWQAMLDNPLFGIGPDHFQIKAHTFGFKKGKAAHSLWFEVGAELGFPGIICLIAFYFLCIKGLWRLSRKLSNSPDADPWLKPIASMVISSLIGFIVSAQFVTVEAVEIPYYVTLLGAIVLKLQSGRPQQTYEDDEEEWIDEEPEFDYAEADVVGAV